MSGPTPSHRNDPGLTLALAMVYSSVGPLLLLDDDFTVVGASLSFCEQFHVDPPGAPGCSLFALGDGEWNVPQLRSLLRATVSGDADIDTYELTLAPAGAPPRDLRLTARRLAYGADNAVRIVLSIADVTAAQTATREDTERLWKKDLANQELQRQNHVLMQEVRHRVANSLQIIASVMMQNARRAASEEVRGQLRDAHNRIMSVAELQQQLAISTLGTVNIGCYLTKLCETIAASMIADPETLSLSVTAEDMPVDAGVSVSLGLIVTELVINALKHGFPDEAHGAITVAYENDTNGWVLSVSDDGVGMPPETTPAKAGLGTSIIEALARQLRAQVKVVRLPRGTRVCVDHRTASSAGADQGLAGPMAAV